MLTAALVAGLFVTTVFAWEYAKQQDPDNPQVIDPGSSDTIPEVILQINPNDPVSAIVGSSLRLCAYENLVFSGNPNVFGSGDVECSENNGYIGVAVSGNRDTNVDGLLGNDFMVDFRPMLNTEIATWGDVFPVGTTVACITGEVRGNNGLEPLDGDMRYGATPLCEPIVLIPPPGDEGCTPGFWKTKPHAAEWDNTPFDQTDIFGSIFASSPADSLTLQEAVSLKGNSFNSLVRHTVAGILNASSPDVEYAFTAQQVIDMFADAMITGDFAGAKALLIAANESSCPL